MYKEETLAEQKKVMDSLKAFIEENGYAPTERELCNKAGISSRAALHRHLVRMKFEGLIDYIPQKSRTIRILREAN